jgi:hypothetical protein
VNDSDQSFSAAALAAEATQRAIERLLRGGTWPGITREIAWRAVSKAGGDLELIVTVAPVADEVLSDLIDGVECRVDTAAVRAWHDHLSWRPHDLEGAELVATITAAEEAEDRVVAAYEETCRRTEEAAYARHHTARAHAARRPRFLRRGTARTKTPLPPLDLGELGRPREQYGWPRREVA